MDKDSQKLQRGQVGRSEEHSGVQREEHVAQKEHVERVERVERKELDEHEENIPLLLQEGLNKLDDLFPSPTPNSAWFAQQIAETQNKQRSRLLGDLLKLWLAALVLLYFLYMTVVAQPVAFLSFQAVAMIAPLAWLILRRQVDSRESSKH